MLRSGPRHAGRLLEVEDVAERGLKRARLDIRRPAFRVDAHRKSVIVELVPHRALGASANAARRPTAARAEFTPDEESGAKAFRSYHLLPVQIWDESSSYPYTVDEVTSANPPLGM